MTEEMKVEASDHFIISEALLRRSRVPFPGGRAGEGGGGEGSPGAREMETLV